MNKPARGFAAEQEVMSGPITRAASIVPTTIDREARTVDVIWTTGATVQRARWDGYDVVSFEEELVVDAKSVRLDRINAGGPFLDSHNSYSLEAVLGTVVPGSVRIADGQGTATVRLTAAEDAANRVARILEGTVRNVSVGYWVHEYQITKRDGQPELWRAVDWEPCEISAVAVPADAGAQVRSAEAASLHPCIIRDASPPATNVAQTRGNAMENETLAGGADQTTRTGAEQTIAPSPAPDILAAERRRASEIMMLAQRHAMPQDFAAKAIADGHTIDQVRGAILNKLAESNPSTRGAEISQPAQVRTDDSAIGVAIENALMHRAHPGRVELAADAREFRGMTLMEIGRKVSERNGLNFGGMGKMEVAGALLTRTAGLMTTGDFANILANIATKTLRQAYADTPRTFTRWTKQATLPDFKSVSRVQLSGAPNLIAVPEGAEISYASMSDGAESYALSTYARIVPISRQVLINDDLSALTRMPAAFGSAAAGLESDIVYGILSTNAAMSDTIALFNASHSNLAGTGTAVTEAAFIAGLEAMGKQVGLEGRLISVMPKYVVTGMGTNGVAARKLFTQITPAQTSNVNVFADQIEVIEEARILAGGSPVPWYLAADPNAVDTIEYGYLQGSNGVYTETRVGFEVDGIEIKARHDFGAKALDWRGLYKNPGV